MIKKMRRIIKQMKYPPTFMIKKVISVSYFNTLMFQVASLSYLVYVKVFIFVIRRNYKDLVVFYFDYYFFLKTIFNMLLIRPITYNGKSKSLEINRQWLWYNVYWSLLLSVNELFCNNINKNL